ncbi:MAG: energy-coupling factor transporter transmembrane protein EcfT [Bifidobacteriaceae bacterium]|nr:energy-coupling factor transporter transmembrane protein EcfT [Bifidobacteriaceae bacterium]
MPVSPGLAYTGQPNLWLDPRAKLALFIVVNIVGLAAPFSGPGAVVRIAATALVAVLLAGEQAWWMAASAVAATACGMAGYAWLQPTGWTLVASGLINLLARFWPVIAMGCYVLSTTTVSEFIAALRRMRVPTAFTIPFAVVMRFLPTLAQESAGISEALRSRGLRLGVARPGAWLEYRLVPLAMRAVAIGDELTAAALTRGLDRDTERTSLARVGFGELDWAVVAAAVAVFIAWLAARLITP